MTRRLVMIACLGMALASLALMVSGCAGKPFSSLRAGELWFGLEVVGPQLDVVVLRGSGEQFTHFLHGFETYRLGARRVPGWRRVNPQFAAALAPQGVWVTNVSIPLWLAFAVGLVYPCVSLCRRVAREDARRARGECLGCGYNLTGLSEPRCPECGRQIEPRTSETNAPRNGGRS